jgi:predicted DNA-binding transcriptional regulator AlpA
VGIRAHIPLSRHCATPNSIQSKADTIEELEEQPDRLVPDNRVADELGVSTMTIWRYEHDQTLDFPPAVILRNRKFRSRRMLEEFKKRLLDEALASRNKGTVPQQIKMKMKKKLQA